MKKWISFLLLTGFGAQAQTRLPIEELMREIQIRYTHTSQAGTLSTDENQIWFNAESPRNNAKRILWKKTPCSQVPPAYPPDGFYGKTLLPEENVFLIQAMLDALNESQLWSYYVTLNGTETVPVSEAAFLSTACTAENCTNLFCSAYDFVKSLQTIRSFPGLNSGLDGRAYFYDKSGMTNAVFRQIVHRDAYNSLSSDEYIPGLSGALLSDYTAGDLELSDYSGFIWHFQQWDSAEDWEAATEGWEWGDPMTASTSTPQYLFSQVMVRNRFELYQPNFEGLSYSEALLFVQIDEAGEGGVYPADFDSENIGEPFLYTNFTPTANTALPFFTPNEEIPDCPDPVEGSSHRVWNWSLNREKTFVAMTMDYKPVADNVLGCSSCLEAPGGMATELSSIHMQIGLGTENDGSISGVLELAAEAPGEAVVHWSRVQLHALSSEVMVTNYSAGRVLSTPQSRIEIIDSSTAYYAATIIAVYTRSDSEGTASLERYYWIGTLLDEYQSAGYSSDIYIDEYDSSNRLLKTTSFIPNENGSWIKTVEKSGQTTGEVLEKYSAGGTNWVVRTKLDDAYGEAARTAEGYIDFDWGRELVQTVRGEGSNALVTTYSYYTDTNSTGYAQLESAIHSDGGWERYEYASDGDLWKTVSSFSDEPITAGENLCRVSTTETVQDGGEQITTDIEKLLGSEISRTYTIRATNTTTTVRCAAPGAAITDPGNLVTTTTYEQDPNDDSPFTGRRVVKVEHADGTLTLKSYPGDTTNITWRGAANAGGTAVVDGTRTVEIRSEFGYVIDRKVYDVATGILIDSEVVTDFHTDGRPIEWQHLDGTTRAITIGCCGTDRETARDGSTRFYEYDPGGYPISISVENGDGEEVAQFSDYDAAGNLRKKGFTVDGHQETAETFVYDTAGRLTVSTNAVGGETVVMETTDTNSLHRIQTTVFPDLGTSVEEYYADGQLYRRTGTAVPHIQMEYGTEGGEAFTKTIQLGDNGETFLWSKTFTDVLGRAYKTVYSDGSSEQSFYNDLGQVEKTVDRDGIVTLFEYNDKGEQEIVALDANRNGTIDYSGMDRITKTTSEIIGAHGTDVRRTVTQVWDTDNADAPRTISIRETSVDGLQSWNTVEGQETSTLTAYTTSEAKRTDTVTNPDDTQLIIETVNGQTSSQTWKDSNGAEIRTRSLDYNERGLIDQQIDSQEGTVKFGYSSKGILASRTRVSRLDAGDTLTESYGYDSSMRVTSVTNADLSVTHTEYAPNGQIFRQYGASVYPIEYDYDSQGRRSTLTTWQDYSAQTGAAVTEWIYNPTNGLLARKEYNDGNGTDYAYMPGGKLKTRTWERGITTTYSYYDSGELQTADYSDNTDDISYTYDRMGRVKTAGNGVADYTYSYSNGLLRTENIVGPVPSPGITITHTYDALSRSSGYNVDAMSPSRSVTYGYDDAGRFSTLTALGSTATYSYNDQGLPAGHSIPDILTVSKGFDGFNRLSAVSNLTGSTSSTISTYTYTHNDLDQRTSMQMQFGSSTAFDSTWNYQYDSLGQLSNAWKTANGAIVPGRQYGYQFDDIGNRLETTRGNNTSSLVLQNDPLVTSTYTPNLLNQYEQRTVPAYAEISGLAINGAVLSFQNLETGEHIRAGRNEAWFHAMLPLTDNSMTGSTNGVRMTAVLPGLGAGGADLINTNQALTLSAMKTPGIFQYDDDGNLLSDGRFIYIWNAENRLVAVSNSIAEVASCKYDHQGRMVSRTLNGVETTFLWEGWNMISEASSSITNAYVWGMDLSGGLQGAGGVGALVSASLNGINVIYCADGNGNVSDLITSGGSTVAHYEYDPFGNQIVGTGSSADLNPWRFSTKYWESETGLLHYEQRPYLPTLGMWANRDPIEEQGGAGLYCFVKNCPVEQIDYLGFVGEPGYKMWGPLSANKNNVPASNPLHNNIVIGGLLDVGGAVMFDLLGDNLGGETLLHYLLARGKSYSMTALTVRSLVYRPQLRSALWNNVSEIRKRGTGGFWEELEPQSTAGGIFSVEGNGDNALGQFDITLRGKIRTCGKEYELQGSIQINDWYDFRPQPGRSVAGDRKAEFGLNWLYGTEFPMTSEWAPIFENNKTKKMVFVYGY